MKQLVEATDSGKKISWEEGLESDASLPAVTYAWDADSAGREGPIRRGRAGGDEGIAGVAALHPPATLARRTVHGR